VSVDVAELYDRESLRVPELESLIEEQLILRVLRELKSGKEATAWVCEAGPTTGMDFVVAKVYRPINERGFKNDAVYQEGRWSDDRRIRRAFEQKSRAGRAAQFSSWVEHEFTTLRLLTEAGADVPRPVTKTTGAILMEFIGDETGPAPLLKDVRLERDEAREVFNRLLWNVERFLACNRVHGDLSPFNILYWEGRAVINDVPQPVDPTLNRNADTRLLRDVANLCTHFRRYGIYADPNRIVGDLWMRWRFG
jgi:RIO kinase 1